MEVILREDVAKLGHRGDIVTVKNGYARNYLLPRKLALEATASNRKQIEELKVAIKRARNIALLPFAAGHGA